MNAFIAALSVLSATLATLLPHEMSSDLSSDVASYDGEVLRLEGNVTLDHELGQMEAYSATLQKSEGFTNLPFSQILLEQEVFISFQNHGELFCDEAHLDFQNLKGTFSSLNYPVLYRDFIEEKKIAFELFGHEIDLILEKNESICEISSLLAKDSVHIDYGKDFHLDSERALYIKEGLLKAFTNEAKKNCHLKHLDDYVDADVITMNLNTHVLTMEEPNGVVSSFFFSDNPERKCHVIAKLLTWDEVNDILTLQNDITLEDAYMGKLIGKETVHITQKNRFGKKVIQTMEALGKTVLISPEGQKLTSFGSLKLDRDSLKLICVSPIIDGITPLDQQLIYEKEDLTIFADTASLEYSFKGLSLKPHVVNLEGHVRIFSREPSQPFRCGIADHIQYDPNTLEIHLFAAKGKHVLFWHQQQNLKLSAPEILITIDPETKEEIINGIGNVRFDFNTEEDKQLETLFPYYRREKIEFDLIMLL